MVDKPLLLFDMDGTLIILSDNPEYQGFSTSYGPYVSLKHQMKRVGVSKGVPLEEYAGLDRMAQIWNKTREYAESNGFAETRIKALDKGMSGFPWIRKR